jgi:hypothetical protein
MEGLAMNQLYRGIMLGILFRAGMKDLMDQENNSDSDHHHRDSGYN